MEKSEIDSRVDSAFHSSGVGKLGSSRNAVSDRCGKLESVGLETDMEYSVWVAV
jgi:hypothetical protein